MAEESAVVRGLQTLPPVHAPHSSRLCLIGDRSSFSSLVTTLIDHRIRLKALPERTAGALSETMEDDEVLSLNCPES